MGRKPKTSRDRILELLSRSRDRHFSPKEIADAIPGLTHDHARQLLRRMVYANEIRIGGSGYCHRDTGLDRNDQAWHVRHALTKCLRNLEDEHFDLMIVARSALSETLDFMVRTQGAAWAKTELEKLHSTSDATLATLEKEYWSDEDDIESQ
jgi:hypothetical protein